MKSLSFIIMVLLAALLISVPVMAGNETANQTVPVILSFNGGHPWGENPIQVMNNATGQIAFIGNTSSRNISLDPDSGYVLRVEPAGLIDAAHTPDGALIGCTEYVGKNPIGCVFFALIIGAFVSACRRKNGGL